MTDPVEIPPPRHPETPAPVPRPETLPDPMETLQAVQQLHDAGFSEDQHAALTTVLLRVLALWTQQATRSDLHTAVHAREQRLAQQLDTLRRAVVQQAETLREEVPRAAAQQADTLATTRAASARRRELPSWPILALLGLTCVGVLLLVLVRVLGWESHGCGAAGGTCGAVCRPPCLDARQWSAARVAGTGVLVCIVAMNACNFAMPSASSVVISYIA